MARGRKPKSRETHLANGSYVKNPNRENKNAPIPIKGRPPIPDSVASDPIAADKWETLCTELEAMGIVATADVDIMEVYCILFSKYRQALAGIRETGLTIDGKRNPLEGIEFRTIQQLTRLMAELGLTPTARERLSATPKDNDDLFLAYLNSE